jgi:hypothetical protein
MQSSPGAETLRGCYWLLLQPHYTSYAAAGRHEEARRMLSELKELTLRGYVRASVFGEIYLALDEIDNAWSWFQKAIADQDPAMITVAIDPFFDSVRNDIRYGELLKRMRLSAKS